LLFPQIIEPNDVHGAGIRQTFFAVQLASVETI
jgi:hypothetical protein